MNIKVFTKKYPPGIITNIELEDFFEPELVIICDPWLDKNALNDAMKTKKKVLGLCDTNNLTKGVNQVIPCNNKAGKSIGLVLYLLAKGYFEEKKEKKKLPSLELWTGEEETGIQATEKSLEVAEEKYEKESEEEVKKEIKEEGGAEEGV